MSSTLLYKALTIVINHGLLMAMEKIAISKFKATCLAILERVHKTRVPVLVTRFGEPVAEIGPPPATARPAGWLGAMQGTGQIHGDVISPVSAEADWDVLRS